MNGIFYYYIQTNKHSDSARHATDGLIHAFGLYRNAKSCAAIETDRATHQPFDQHLQVKCDVETVRRYRGSSVCICRVLFRFVLSLASTLYTAPYRLKKPHNSFSHLVR